MQTSATVVGFPLMLWFVAWEILIRRERTKWVSREVQRYKPETLSFNSASWGGCDYAISIPRYIVDLAIVNNHVERLEHGTLCDHERVVSHKTSYTAVCEYRLTYLADGRGRSI